MLQKSNFRRQGGGEGMIKLMDGSAWLPHPALNDGSSRD